MLLLALPIFAQEQATTGPRFALVIGNGDYTDMPRLRNPVNDATDIAAKLKVLGFEVFFLHNANRKEINSAITHFHECLAQDRRSEGFFYYAGHGVQAKGVNYLIPIGADINSEADLEDEAVSLQRILGNIEEAGNRVNIIVLDACRNNPLPAKARSAERGLAMVAIAPPESVVLFSTAANETATDGDGRNSPFANALLDHLADPGDITTTIKAVTAEVKNATGGQQTPYQYTSLDLNFSLNPKSVSVTTVTRSYGSIAVSVVTAGTLYMDGIKTADLPAGADAKLDSVEEGEHNLELHYADGQVEQQTVTIKARSEVNVSFTYTKTLEPPKISTEVEMVFVQGGTFIMGSPESEEGRDSNENQHEVALSSFYIGKFDVTQDLYQRVMGKNPSSWGGDKNRPIDAVSWYDAISFCNKLSERDKLKKVYSIRGTNVQIDWSANGYRLPTEAEWEYAARGGQEGESKYLEFAGSNDPEQVAWYNNNSGGSVHPVGQKVPNALGLYDMSGNIAQWCWDSYEPYATSKQIDPQGPPTGGYHICRGGGWSSDMQGVRVAKRDRYSPSARNSLIGFRIVHR